MMCTEVGRTTMAYVAAFGAYEAREQRERASAMFEQLAARVGLGLLVHIEWYQLAVQR